MKRGFFWQKHSIRSLIFYALACAMFVVIGAGVYVSGEKAHASDELSWFSSQSPTLQTVSIVGPHPSGNRDCRNTTFVTARYLGLLDSTREVCVLETPLGQIAEQGYIKTNFEPVAASFLSMNGNRNIIGIPNSTTVATVTSSGGFSYMQFTTSAAEHINVSSNAFTHEITYALNQPPDHRLKRLNDESLGIDFNSVAFSNNGLWMVAAMPNAGLVRLDLTTFEVKQFAPALVYYGYGLNPVYSLAISNDGRVVAEAISNHGYFRIHDTENCASITKVSVGVPNFSCPTKDLGEFISSKVDIGKVSTIRMLSNERLSFFEGQDQKILSAPGFENNTIGYLGMGDSFSSGEGELNGSQYYIKGTDNKLPLKSTNNTCHTSKRSYPYLLSQIYAILPFHTIACSGALTEDINNPNNSAQYTIPSNAEFRNFFPGGLMQISSLTDAMPEFITLTIGGNDIGFSSKIIDCLGLSTCLASKADRINASREIYNVFDTLVKTYQDMMIASPNTKIFVLSYPRIINPTGSCGLNVHLNSTEAAFADELTMYLNDVIEAATKKAGVIYVNIEDSLVGHRLCDASKEKAVNGLTAGNDQFIPYLGPFANESYHPNSLGHELMAAAFQARVSSIGGAKSSGPEASIEAPLPPTSFFAAGNIDYDPNIDWQYVDYVANKPTQITDAPYAQPGDTVNLNELDAVFKANSEITVELHSDPKILTVYNAGLDGRALSTSVVIPSGTAPGYHSLHVKGVLFNGRPADFYQTIFVRGPEGDIDGDGVPDASDRCPFVTPADVDEDADGRDDACDGYIGDKPSVTKSVAVIQGAINTTSSASPQNAFTTPASYWRNTATSASMSSGADTPKLSISEDVNNQKPHTKNSIPFIKIVGLVSISAVIALMRKRLRNK